jgi:paraquat-inducible protein B
MSKMANKSVIGAFVIGAIALAVIAVMIFGSGKFLRKQQEFIMYFQGSIKGLSIGSPVIFRGVKIGEVKDIKLQARISDLSFFIPVLVEIDTEKVLQEGAAKVKPYQYIQALIDKGLRAQLQSQSFVTGQLAVAVDFFPDKPAKLVGLDKKYREIPTVSTPLEDLEKSLKDLDLKGIIEKVKSTMDGIDKAVNSPEIQKTLKSAAGAAEDARMMIKTMSSQLGPLAANANGTMKDVQKLVQTLDRNVTTLLPAVEATMKDAQKMVQTMDRNVTTLLPAVEAAVKDAQKLVQTVDGQVPSLASNAGDTVKDVQKLIQTLDRNVTTLLPAVEATMKDAQTLVQNLNGQVPPLAASANDTVKDVQKLVQNVNGQVTTLLPALEATVKDAQVLVKNLDVRIEPVTSNATEALKGVNTLVNNDVKNLVGNLDRGIGQVLPAIVASLEALRGTLVEAQATLKAVGGSAGAASPLIYQVTKTLEEVSNSARALRSLTEYMDRHPESLIRGR